LRAPVPGRALSLQALAERVNLAVSEAVSNVVKYAYEPGTFGSIGMKAAIADGFLKI
jgi:anti-sigma regulatory factor (Ser/Thr protein kinase)